jgi:hypothetical protein
MMARPFARTPVPYARSVSDLEKPSMPTSMKVVVVGVIVVVAWLVLLPVLSLARSLLSLALYVIVALVAFQLGKVSGRRGD